MQLWIVPHWTFIGFVLLQLDRNKVSAANRSTIDLNRMSVSRLEDSFRCYVCFWSANDEPCGDIDFSLRHGEPGKFMFGCLACYKQVLFNGNGEKQKILRGCAQETPYYALTCQNIYNRDGSYQQTCACSSEYCNSAINMADSELRLRIALVTSLGLLIGFVWH